MALVAMIDPLYVSGTFAANYPAAKVRLEAAGHTVSDSFIFTTLQAWLTYCHTQNTNINTAGGLWAECRAGGDLGESTVTDLTGTASATDYVNIYAAPGHEQRAIAGDPTTASACVVADGAIGIEIRTDFTRVEGLHIVTTDRTGINVQTQWGITTAKSYTIQRNHIEMTLANQYKRGIYVGHSYAGTYTVAAYIYDNIVSANNANLANVAAVRIVATVATHATEHTFTLGAYIVHNTFVNIANNAESYGIELYCGATDAGDEANIHGSVSDNIICATAASAMVCYAERLAGGAGTEHHRNRGLQPRQRRDGDGRE